MNRIFFIFIFLVITIIFWKTWNMEKSYQNCIQSNWNKINQRTKPSNCYDEVKTNLCSKRSWKDLMKPCKDRMKWDNQSSDRNSSTNLLLSKISIQLNPPGVLSFINIQTVDILNRSKSIGGDFWWINLIGPSSFHIDITDNSDGTYQGFFELMEHGRYDVIVFLEYSLCDGIRDPPHWWFRKGKFLVWLLVQLKVI